MGIIGKHFGQPSYFLGSNLVDLRVTVQGGHLTADFKSPDRGFKGNSRISPFFIAPWWKEAPGENQDEIINVLRGDFFCLPFGGNDEEYEGRKYPVHGETANSCWDFISLKEEEKTRELVLQMKLEGMKGRVEKHITLAKDEPVVYSLHRIIGFSGRVPIGHHPTLKLPETVGSGIIDMTRPLEGFTTPSPVEKPSNRGYSRIAPGRKIRHMRSVPCMDGSHIDITRYPQSFGYEDIVLFVNDSGKDFVFTSLSVPSEGYLYFQLKNPRVLRETLLWMSNGGRHYPPWNGRVRAVLGMEEITAFYHYGIKPSIESNALTENSYPTSVELLEDRPFDVKLVMGAVSIGEDFTGVTDIVRKNDSEIIIIGRGGERIEVRCKVDFLSD